MSERTNTYTISHDSWTKIASDVTGIYVEALLPYHYLNYLVRILDTGDDAPTDDDDIDMETDIFMFQMYSTRDSVSLAEEVDIYCRMDKNTTGKIKVLT